MLNENLKNIVYRDGQLYYIKDLESFYKELLDRLDENNFAIILHCDRSTFITKSEYIHNSFSSGKYKLNFFSPDKMMYIQVNDFEDFYVGHPDEKKLCYIMRKNNAEIIFEFDI